MRVRPWPEFDFGWPGPPRREDRRCGGKRRGSGKGGRQALPLVFEGTKLSVQFLQLSVLLGLKGYHLSDVPIEQKIENKVKVVRILQLRRTENDNKNI